MTAEAKDNEALVAFIHALGVTVLSLDDLPPAERTAANFITCLDGYLGVWRGMAGRDGPGVFRGVQVLRQHLDMVMDQASLARMPDGGATH